MLLLCTYNFNNQSAENNGTRSTTDERSAENEGERSAENEGERNGNSKNNKLANGFHDDPYEQIVRSSLKIMDKQKVTF